MRTRRASGARRANGEAAIPAPGLDRTGETRAQPHAASRRSLAAVCCGRLRAAAAPGAARRGGRRFLTHDFVRMV
eukprot:394273-Prymnesium_polylepis.2